MKSDPTPPSMRTAAISLLFKDGFSISDLVEVFSLSSLNVEEHIRRVMFNGHAKLPPVDPVTAPASSAPKTKGKKPEQNSKRPEQNSCTKHPGSKLARNGECKKCKVARVSKEWYDRNKKQPAAQSVGAAAVTEMVDDPPVVIDRPYSSDSRGNARSQTAPTGSAPGENESTFQKIAAKATTRAPEPLPSNEIRKVYTRETRCPKCFNLHRFWRRAEADMAKDHWVSLGCQHTLKIANYKLSEDRHYAGAVA